MSQNKMERVRNLSRTAKDLELDWVLCMLPENIFYFSGFRTTFYTRFIGVLIPVKEDRAPVLIASFIDRQLIETDLWSPHWFDETVLWGPTAECKYKTHWEALAAYLRPGIRLGADAIQFDFYEQLIGAFPGTEVINLMNEILHVRAVKDDDEINKIKAAFNLAEDIMDQVPAWLQHPITEAELANEMNYAALKAGAEAIFYPTLVSCGEKMLAFHSPPLNRPIKQNELIRIAFGLQVDGYGSDIVRNFCRGKPPAEMEPLKEAFFGARQTVFDMLRPGVGSAELLKAVEDLYRERGVLENWPNNIGHGLALTIHEFPRIAGDDKTIIQENMVLAIEPILMLPPHGAIAHCDGILVTGDGSEWLSGRVADVVVV